MGVVGISAKGVRFGNGAFIDMLPPQADFGIQTALNAQLTPPEKVYWRRDGDGNVNSVIWVADGIEPDEADFLPNDDGGCP